MKIFRKILAIAYLLIAASDIISAAPANSGINIRRILSDEKREISGFNGISSAGSYHLFITMGNTESLRLEGDAELIKEIETKVENGVLKIRNKKQMNYRSWNNRGRINIYIQAKTLNSILLSGSGNITVGGKINTEKLSNTISGSGSIDLTMDVDDYAGTISGSGTIIAKGKADNASITVAGSGNFDGDSLRTANAATKVSGSGNISIHTDKNLDAILSGSGNVRYSGNANVKSTKSGSGRISKR